MDLADVVWAVAFQEVAADGGVGEDLADCGQDLVAVGLIDGERWSLIAGLLVLIFVLGGHRGGFFGFAFILGRSRYAKGADGPCPSVGTGSVMNASGQPPCWSMTSSISAMTRMVSLSATTIFW